MIERNTVVQQGGQTENLSKSLRLDGVKMTHQLYGREQLLNSQLTNRGVICCSPIIKPKTAGKCFLNKPVGSCSNSGNLATNIT